MKTPLRTPVALIGGGPCALVLALLLDRYGVGSVVFDAGDSPDGLPLGTTLSARTMEHSRQLGVSGLLRRLGLPGERSRDIAFFTRYGDHELTRLPLPSGTERLRRVAAASQTDQVPEPAHHAGAHDVEGLLREHAATRPNIALRRCGRVARLDQDAEHVRVHVEDAKGAVTEWLARYVVIGEGAGAPVYDALRVHWTTPAAGRDVRNRWSMAARLRMPTFDRAVSARREAWSHWAVNPEFVVDIVALGGADEFLLLKDCPDPAPIGAEQVVSLVHRATAARLPVEVLDHRLRSLEPRIADRFRKGRIFLAGRGAHGGSSDIDSDTNNGIGDAANLAWKLAARLQGWGGPWLLDSYDSERRAAALRNAAADRAVRNGLSAIDRTDGMEKDTPEGRTSRERIGWLLRSHGARALPLSLGLQLGTRYDASPVVVPDPEAEAPADSWGTYTPTSVPGGRAPHLWLDDWHGPGSSLFDRLGPAYTLLRLGPEPPIAKPLQAAAQAHGMPLEVLDVGDAVARDLYERDLVLIRPDQHVAWRGNELPTDPADLVALVTGMNRSAPSAL